VSTAAYRAIANSCARELDAGCHSFISFLISMFHHGAEIATVVLEQIQQQLRTSALESPESCCDGVGLVHQLGWWGVK